MCCHLLHLLVDFPDPRRFQSSKHSSDQRKWLTGKFELYKEHHNTKTLSTFFPALYKEYLGLWPPAPVAKDIEAAGGNLDVAIAGVRKTEETVRGFEFAGRPLF